MAKGNRQKSSDGSALDFEAQLWAAADKMRGHMDASGYNGARPEGLCLGLIFLKYISDAFEEKREQLLFGFSDPKSEWFIKDEPERADAAENRDEYLAANVFWLPPEARWHTINARAKSPEIGKVIDDAMVAIERENPTLKGVLPRDTSCVNRRMNRAFSLSASTGERVGVRCRIPRNADTFRNVQRPDLRADFVTANALRDSASNRSKPYAADGKRPITTFFKN